MDAFSDNISLLSFSSTTTEYVLQKLEETSAKQNEILKLLPNKMSEFHTSILFYRFKEGQRDKQKSEASCKVWDVLVKTMGSVADIWRTVGEAFGVTKLDLDYIEYSKQDNMDVLLKFVTRDENATLDILLDALVDNEYYGILQLIQTPLLELKEVFETQDDGYYSGSNGNSSADNTNNTNTSADNTNNTNTSADNTDNTNADNTYSFSISKSDTTDSGHNTPDCTSNNTNRRLIKINSNMIEDIINDVPIGLRRYPTKPLPPLQSNGKDITNSDRLTLFLTYAEDGIFIARDIKASVSYWTEFPKEIQVVTLNDIDNDIEERMKQKPNFNVRHETIIREYYEKANLVIPIVTEGYMKEIKRDGSNLFLTSTNMDCKYVHYIYETMLNGVLQDGCINKKVRSVIPNNYSAEFLRDLSGILIFSPWTNVDKFDVNFKAFLNHALRKFNFVF